MTWCGTAPADPIIYRAIVAIYPRGWVDLSRVKLNEYFNRQVAAVDASREPNALALEAPSKDETLTLRDQGFMKQFPYVLALFSIPPGGSVRAEYLHLAAKIEITRTACQLARYQIKHGAFPDLLEKLVPEFVPQVPRDPMDNAPLRYRLTETGYDLWSIGLDRKDDGGQNRKYHQSWREALDWVFQH